MSVEPSRQLAAPGVARRTSRKRHWPVSHAYDHSSMQSRREAMPRLDPQDRERALDLITKGMGRSAVCRDMGITMKALCGEIVADPSFREAVETAEAARFEDCESVLYEAAMNGAVNAAAAYIKVQFDKQAIEEARRTNKARLANESKIADAYASGASGVNVAVLTPVQLERFQHLTGLMQAGRALTDREKIEHCDLLALGSRRPEGDDRPAAEGEWELVRGMTLGELEATYHVDSNEGG